ncbi:MAG: hybrid sensor histidine kinase/response regulator [bacterium]
MPDKPAPGHAPGVLIVDDTPANLQVLAEMLKDHGYHVRMARSGALALKAAQHDPPDLILLDITMPEMDGYEVCARFKANAQLREIPVIFISALTEPLDKIKAFNAGGVDYLPKPFYSEEVVARVRTHLELRRQRQELQDRVAQLRELEHLRDSLVHMIVHDLRAPLNGLQGGLELLDITAKALPEESRKWLVLSQGSCRKLAEMISTLLDITRLEHNQMPLHPAPANLAELVRHGIDLLGPTAQVRCVVEAGGASSPVIPCDAALMVRVITNLVGNALKFSPETTRVRVALGAEGAGMVLRVTDSGPGIPAPYHAKIFEKFGQAELQREHQQTSTGLGLAFCKLAIEAHGGKIGVISKPGEGSTFWFELPLRRDAAGEAAAVRD